MPVPQDSELEELARRLVAALVDSGVPRELAVAAAQRSAAAPSASSEGKDASADPRASRSTSGGAVRPLDAVTTELTDVVADLQRQLQDAQDSARRLGAERAGLADAVRRRDAEIERLSRLSQQTPGAPPASVSTAPDAETARVVQQLHDQVDFLTAELLRRDPAGGDGFPGQGGARAWGGGGDEVSQAAALELEVARLATQLRTALGAAQRSEETAAALQAEVRGDGGFVRVIQPSHLSENHRPLDSLLAAQRGARRRRHSSSVDGIRPLCLRSRVWGLTGAGPPQRPLGVPA